MARTERFRDNAFARACVCVFAVRACVRARVCACVCSCHAATPTPPFVRVQHIHNKHIFTLKVARHVVANERKFPRKQRLITLPYRNDEITRPTFGFNPVLSAGTPYNRTQCGLGPNFSLLISEVSYNRTPSKRVFVSHNKEQCKSGMTFFAPYKRGSLYPSSL